MSNHSLPKSCALSLIERDLQLRAVSVKGANAFVNARPLWNPPWGRGIYGGAMVAQSLSAAQTTVPSSFSVHSMHCHFLRAASMEIPIIYTVELVRAGKTLITRTVHASQKGSRIFAATISFMREVRVEKLLEHSVSMPAGLTPPPDALESTMPLSKANQTGEERLCDCIRCPVSKPGRPEARKLLHWMRARGHISERPFNAQIAEEESQDKILAEPVVKNHQRHAMALAYMTDTYFIGAVARAHNASRFSNQRIVDAALSSLPGSKTETEEKRRFFENVAREEMEENKDMPASGQHIKMMVSVDRTIFFHNPRTFRADEWMLVEMDTPWAGHERGLVMQRIWNRDGTLIATCMQEGLVRVFQEALI